MVSFFRNLLRPSGVRLQAGTLHVKIYRAEDLPQMDPGYFEGVKKFLNVGTVQKEFVDPFCSVNFAGHKGKTKVIWNEQDPEWNQQINLAIRVSYGLIIFEGLTVCRYQEIVYEINCTCIGCIMLDLYIAFIVPINV